MAEESPHDTAPYSALAVGYDLVMEHVDYDAWAAYVHQLLEAHGRDVEDVLELGCGTGSLALELQPMGPYQYTGTDRSPQMVRVAQIKADEAGAPLAFAVQDFTDFEVEAPVDAVVLLYDGLNYILESEGVRALFRNVHQALRPGGIFCFDQSTPVNSVNNSLDFEDEGESGGFAYVRRSHYNPEERLHTTVIEMTIRGQEYVEKHVQRAYTFSEIRALIQGSPLREVGAFHNFTLNPATGDSERVHWVVQHPPDAADTAFDTSSSHADVASSRD